ncbi:Crp/Fnr family transcriptional regulator [Spirosoma rhododendri]|uniref:Crp/Fnr family transcriptional regulator n=1 Tax=Spirosoma rhododendri TaxID=2728024 RepID=A0A7L5DT71_9BACT|nr:Crp/Fnr family transcriptional regulator [Spirosoma rhododendri]QJD80812.1 Crp/Fnr family transcriptional regulator [Spirosoma rhododendri]
MNQLDLYLRSKGQFTDDDLLRIQACATPVSVRKRQSLLCAGDVCRHKLFVLSGLLRVYRVSKDGAESVMRFAAESQWAIDPESYVNETPSHCYIEALEDTTLLLWTKETMNELFAAIPTFRQLSDRVREESHNESLQRIFANISYTAEEKYDAFVAEQPAVLRRVPLHMVASYLGVTRETLSRVRQKHHQLR